MSLFKAREWWSTTSGFEEFHDFGCLCVANIDNSPTWHDKVIVGSFQGLIRIYTPHPPSFAASHVILEKQLGSPVLQVAASHFIYGSNLLYLAVLHPHLLSVYSVVMETSTDLEPTYSLLMNFSHRLKRTASNMVWGEFEGVEGRGEQICVQSMDGQLSFFHHDTPTFSCFLPDFLLPGPLGYIQQTGSLVTVNSAHMLQVFKYQSLSVAGSGSDEQKPDAGSAGGSANVGKKLSPDWAVNLGEDVVHLQVVETSAGPSHVLVLGERSLFCLTQTGVVHFTKKLDFIPSCLYSYSATSTDGSASAPVIRTLLASHSNQLLVLQDSRLIWAASLDCTPVQLSTANFQEQNGIIVALDEQGHLSCSYLGTDPTVFSAAKVPSRNLSFEQMEGELSDLNKMIKESTKDGIVVGRVEHQTLKLWADFQPDQVRLLELEEEEEEPKSEGGLGTDTAECKPIKKCLEVKVCLSSSSGPSIRDVTLSITTSLPLTTHPSHLLFPEVFSSQECLVTVVCTPSLLPVTTSLYLSATYQVSDGSQQVVGHEVKLPLHLFCEPIYPEKAATFKVTLDASPCEPAMAKLFPPALLLSHAPPQAQGVRYLCGPIVTVVASKGTQRYRLQSNSLAALATTLNWLLHSLQEYFKTQDETFSAKFTPPLPLNEYFEIIDRHFKLRKNLEQCQEWLERHAHQFRSIQKRLLTRFKDKTPVGLAHLDTLLDGTYMQLMALSDKSDLLELELQECSNQLSCTTLLINTLLRLCSNMTEEDFTILTAAMTPVVSSDGDQGWEELVDAAVTHLLRTSLAKSNKDQQQVSVLCPTLAMPADNHKLKKHIALLCDRISKGFLPSGKKSPTEATQSLIQFTSSGTPDDKTGSRHGGAGFSTITEVTTGHSRQPPMPALPEHSSEENV